MNAKELAQALDGSEYGRGFPSRDHVRLAAESGLVICYGASDDLLEFDGAFQDEVGAPGNAFLGEHGLLQRECDDDRCPHELARQKAAPRIKAIWHDKDGPCWTIETAIPHEKFRLMEDGEVFCEGIVFHLRDIPEGGGALVMLAPARVRELGFYWAMGMSVRAVAGMTGLTETLVDGYFRRFDKADRGCPSEAVNTVIDKLAATLGARR